MHNTPSCPIAALVFAAAFSGTANAQHARTSTSFTPVSLSSIMGVQGIDTNDDGADDAVVIATNPIRYQVFHSTHDGWSEQPTVTLTGTNVNRVHKADVNGDGRVDLLLLSTTSSLIHILLNNGQGGFDPAPSSPLPTIADPASFTIADINDDSIPDLIVARSGTVAIHRGLGAAGFGLPTTHPITTGTITDLVVADVRGVGSPAINVLTGNTLRFLYRDGTGVFSHDASFNTGTTGFRMSATDLNGDGRAELIITLQNRADALFVSFNPANGTYSATLPPTSTINPSITDAAFADITGNGKLDIIQGFAGFSAVRLLYAATGIGHAYREIHPPIGEHADLRYTDVLDANGDGRPDLLFVSTSTANPGLILFTNDPAAEFRLAGMFQQLSVTPTRLIRMADVSGLASFLVGHNGSSELRRARIQPSLLGFSFVETLLAGSLGGATTGRWNIADVNGDGMEDIVELANISNIARFRWRLAEGQDTYGPVLNRIVPNTTNLTNLVQADLNADGIDDLAALGVDGNVYITYGNPSGFISEPVSFPMSTANPGSLAIADLDNDGLPDLVCLNRLSGTQSRLHIAYGLPGGSFEPPVALLSLPAAGSASDNFIDIGDLNGDGFPDIVVAGSQSSAVHLSSGPRSYLPFEIVFIGSNLVGVRIVDFDNDGWPDIATTHRGFTEIVSRQGSGLFQARSRFLHASLPVDMHYQDINGDGLPEMIYATSNGASIVYNRSIPRCVADHFFDGVLDLFDIAQFVRDFNARNTLADITQDGRVDYFDLARFIQLFSAGCP